MATTEEELEASPAAGANGPTPATEAQAPGPGATPSVTQPGPDGDEDEEVVERPANRIAVACAFPTVAAALMVGGIFTGVSPRIYAGVAGVAGVGLAFVAAKLRGRPIVSNVVIILGLFVVGAILVGPANLLRVQRLVDEALKDSSVLRPPVEFEPGWKAIVGWLMAAVGFSCGWVAIALRKPALALLLPLPVAAFAGISVPDDNNTQIFSGIAVLVLFAISLGILSSEQSVGEDGEAPSVAYELRKAAKALPLLVALTVGLYFLGQSNLLFPDSLIDPAQEPQRPKAQPLSAAEDRVLFEVESTVKGPWRTGVLDVYDDKDGFWKLPPFAQSEFEDVPRSGIVDPDFQPSITARITVAGLGGAVLPGLPNTAGVIAEGPKLAFDRRAGNIRLVNGTATPGFQYTVAAAGLPKVVDLTSITNFEIPANIRRFTEMPAPPPAAADLISRAEAAGPSKWEQFDFARTFVLDNVTASGTGTPVAVTTERVQDILAGSQTASPFEIVATQAMLARWQGIPARIGYGFDGGEEVGGKLQVHPTNGAAFPEVYFPSFKWLPVIGTPRRAEPTVGSDPSQQRLDPNILPSDDIAVQIFLPTFVPPDSVVTKQIAVIVLITAAILLLAALLYTIWPAIRKARLRSRRRAAVIDAGVRAQVALAYAEWRDYATDFGFLYPTDTPLMFLDRFQEDAEHTELAWLTTRVLWGDLQGAEDPMLATVATELSRSLRRRLASAQPGTVRAVSQLSRLSLRNPYAPETDLTRRPAPVAPTRREDDHVEVPV